MRRLFAPLLAAALAIVVAAPVAAVDDVDTSRLRDAVTVGGIMAHQRVFQRIANQNDGTRASGTPGFDASAEYVKRVMKHAGYRVTEQTFDVPVLSRSSHRRSSTRCRRRRRALSRRRSTTLRPAM